MNTICRIIASVVVGVMMYCIGGAIGQMNTKEKAANVVLDCAKYNVDAENCSKIVKGDLTFEQYFKDLMGK